VIVYCADRADFAEQHRIGAGRNTLRRLGALRARRRALRARC